MGSRLLVAGADPTANYNKATREAARLGFVSMLELFFRSGVKLTGFKVGPLSAASANNQITVIKFLLTLPGLTSQEMESACWRAFANGHAKALCLVLEAGGNISPNDLVRNMLEQTSVKCFRVLQRFGYQLAPFADEIIWRAALGRGGPQSSNHRARFLS